jgi:alkylation response protein AidB-like acyl-CoA dehydrogenase
LDLRDSAQDEAFRDELRAWLADAIRAQGPPPPMHDLHARRAYDSVWQRRLFDAGYAGLHWPKEYGGQDASLTQQLIFNEECARADAPMNATGFVSLLHGGPTLIAEGTPEQKQRHLPYMLRGEQCWCQCFSEPSAGSDLAGLRTTAVRDGDDYVVNGHKIWTSMAQVADYAELLVRTDPSAPKHRGITWLILDMRSPGIEIRPLRTLVGSEEFSEVFLENVRVPVANRVGEENDGWRVSNVTLRFERGTAFSGQIVALQRMISQLVELAQRVPRDRASAWDDRQLRREIGRYQAEVDGLLAMLKLSISEAEKTGIPGLGGSALKLCYSEVSQGLGELGMRLAARAGLAREDVGGLATGRIPWGALGSLQSSIAAGTSQIQRNIIAERILGQAKDR